MPIRATTAGRRGTADPASSDGNCHKDDAVWKKSEQ